MRIRKFAAALFFLLAFIVSMTFMLTPQVVHAQCYDPTGAPIPCKKQQSTDVPPSATPTATGTPTFLFVPQKGGEGGTLIPIGTAPTSTPNWTATIFQTYEACYKRAIETMNALTPPVSNVNPPLAWENTMDALTLRCWQTAQPTATKIVIQPIAGPVFLAPGVKNALILVMIIGVLITGGVLIARLGKK